jgi:hypothetical protein
MMDLEAHPPQHRDDVVDEELGVLEDDEHAEVRADADREQPSCAPPIRGLGDLASEIEIEEPGAEQERSAASAAGSASARRNRRREEEDEKRERVEEQATRSLGSGYRLSVHLRAPR